MYLGNRWIVATALLGFALLGSACTPKKKPESPEAVLQAYVTTAINAKSGADKERLYEFTTGKALERLQAMPEEEFVNSLVKPEYKFVHFSTRDLREEKEGSMSLVYEIVYDTKSGDQGAKITSRKIAYMKKDNGVWKIEDTRNIKSFVEVKEGLNVQYP